MPATRTHDPQSSGSKPKRQYRNKDAEPKSTAAPGVSKIKANLRQVRRLLAKDKLGADVRVETERRLKALEADLATAEQSSKERTLATRYHHIKFFERQKVVRKLTQTKKQLAAAETDKKKLKQLLDLRVDLNYILHYPKTKKYISLFPPELRTPDVAASSSKAEGKKPATAPPKLITASKATEVESDSTKTDTEREEIRKWIRERMEKGELSADPEMHLDERSGQDVGYAPQAETGKTKQSGKVEEEKKMEIENDAFFGEDGSDSE